MPPGRSKACSTCWLRRTKCDGRRPCGRCERLLIRDCRDRDPAPQDGRGHRPRLERACTPCAASKVRCEADRPCRRCVRLGIARRCCEADSIECLSVESLLVAPVALPESLTTLFRHAHRMFDRDSIRSLRHNVPAYLRSLAGFILKPHDLQSVEEEICGDMTYDEIVPPTAVVAGSSPRSTRWQTPMIIFTALIPGDGGPAVRIATPNPAASDLLGYTQQEMAAATADYNSRPHGEFISPLFKLIHPSSWPAVAYAFCRDWMFGCVTIDFGRITLLRKDALPVEAFVSMTIRRHVSPSPGGPIISHHIVDINVADP